MNWRVSLGEPAMRGGEDGHGKPLAAKGRHGSWLRSIDCFSRVTRGAVKLFQSAHNFSLLARETRNGVRPVLPGEEGDMGRFSRP